MGNFRSPTTHRKPSDPLARASHRETREMAAFAIVKSDEAQQTSREIEEAALLFIAGAGRRVTVALIGSALALCLSVVALVGWLAG